jgi:hypothetical protein
MKAAGFLFLLILNAAILTGSTPPLLLAALLPNNQETRIIPLREVEDPRQICAENGKVYIVDKRDILVYDLKDGRLITRIGKIGQGPGEFVMGPLGLTVYPDRLVVKDLRKIKIFTLGGVYSGEIKEPKSMGYYPFLPVGNNFVGFPMETREDGSLAPPSGFIFDKELKPKRKFYGELPPGPPPPPRLGSRPPAMKTDVSLVLDYVDYTVSENRIYVADSRKGVSISVFDENGDLLYEIHHPFERIKVPKGYLNAELGGLRSLRNWDLISAHQNFVVPEYFPAFVGFKIDGGRIYMLTPAHQRGLYEIIVLDLQGRILDKEFCFPIKPNLRAPQIFGLAYDVENGHFIWYAYNETKEIYELHIL